jgi:hypothetical protein
VLELVRRCPSPIVLELEDGHLIRESLPLLNTLVQHCSQLPLLIVLAYRDNERPRLPQELPGANVMRLEAFNEDGVRDMVTAILGPALGRNETLVKFLTRETEGNAFFLVEAIRTLAEESGRLDRYLRRNSAADAVRSRHDGRRVPAPGFAARLDLPTATCGRHPGPRCGRRRAARRLP